MKITLVMAYFENGQMLKRHLHEWRDWSDEAAADIKVIIVDDGSANDPAELRLRQKPDLVARLNIECYRVLGKKIPWNQHGARNLGMMKAPDGWCLMTDMDHLLTAQEAGAMVSMELAEGNYYVPSRINSDGQPKHRHPNSFILTRESFWQSGGYDEDFCGWYGSDSVFRRILDVGAHRVEADHPQLVLFGRDVIPDASTRVFGRKDTPYHSPNNPILRAKRRGPPYKAANPIRFLWERVI